MWKLYKKLVVTLCLFQAASLVCLDEQKKLIHGYELLKSLVVYGQEYAASTLFEYMHTSFKQYQKDNAVASHVFMTYIPGKYLYHDINGLYYGETVLHTAAHKNDIDLVKVLLFLGADPYIKDAQGLNAFDLAKQVNNQQLHDVFLSYVENKKPYINHVCSASWYQALVHKGVHLARPMIARQAMDNMVSMLKKYAQRGPITSQLLLFFMQGYLFEDLMNSSLFQYTFLQRSVAARSTDFTSLLLYMGANPLAVSSKGTCAFGDVVYSFDTEYTKLFWRYLSETYATSDMLSALQPYKFGLYVGAVRDFVASGSGALLVSLMNYFETMGISESQLHVPVVMKKIINQINFVAQQYDQPIPFEVGSDYFTISSMKFVRGKLELGIDRQVVQLQEEDDDEIERLLSLL